MKKQLGAVIEPVPCRGVEGAQKEYHQLKTDACSQGAREDAAVP